MPSLYVRIDDRLVHAQVVDGWLKPLAISQVLIVSDRISAEPFQQTLMKLAATESISVLIMNVLDSIEWLRKRLKGAEKVMILASSPQEVLRLIENGISFPSVTLGGIRSPHPEVELSPALALDRSDCDALRKISQLGVKVEAQPIPADPPKDILDLIPS